MTEKKNETKKFDKWEIAGYAGLFLTVAGQVLIGITYMGGQTCWLVANALYLSKAFKQDLGKAEIVRNVAMSALTAGLMVAKALGAF